MSKPDRPIAYVMEQTLGSVTHYLNLREHEGESGRTLPLWLPIEYRGGFLPWTIHGSLMARRTLAPVLREIDGIFVHTTTLAPFCYDFFAKKPAVVSSDGTPLNKRSMRVEYGLKPESFAAELSKRAVYRRVFARASGFVAWSNWTKQSFVDDYGCDERNVAVIPPGIHLDKFAPGDRDHELPRILFVGGDFGRKGGDLLLDVFRRRLKGRAELELVTRARISPEPGVRVHNGVQVNSLELRRLYADSDIFALPTRADCYSIVCMEALAAGLPIVATRVGGIPDLIEEGKTGHAIDVGHAEALGDALESLVSDAARRRAMSEACREDAHKRFDIRENARRLFQFVRSRC